MILCSCRTSASEELFYVIFPITYNSVAYVWYSEGLFCRNPDPRFSTGAARAQQNAPAQVLKNLNQARSEVACTCIFWSNPEADSHGELWARSETTPRSLGKLLQMHWVYPFGLDQVPSHSTRSQEHGVEQSTCNTREIRTGKCRWAPWRVLVTTSSSPLSTVLIKVSTRHHLPYRSLAANDIINVGFFHGHQPPPPSASSCFHLPPNVCRPNL